MPVIDPRGLFEGQRLANCCDKAQLYWPRLYCAANGYARLEWHPPTIITRCFRNFKQQPREDELLSVIDELVENCLVIPFQAQGRWWLQFVTEAKFLPRHKTADDQRSPAPPAEVIERFQLKYEEWKKTQAEENQTDDKISEIFRKNFREVSERFPRGIGGGIGGGEGEGGGVGGDAPPLQHVETNHEEPPAAQPDREITPAMIAHAVMEELCLGGSFLLQSLTEVVSAELKHGGKPDEIRDAMIAARRQYERDFELGKLQRTIRPEDFFANGDWNKRATWPWKEGMQPKRQEQFREKPIWEWWGVSQEEYEQLVRERDERLRSAS